MPTYKSQKAVEGQLPAEKSTVYTVPPKMVAQIEAMTVTNGGDTELDVNIYFKRGVSRRVIPKDYCLLPGASMEVNFNRPHVLEAGDEIEADAGAAGVADFWISLTLVA